MASEKKSSPILELIAAVLNILGQVPESFLLLLCRLGVGSVFFKSGLTKIDLETLSIAPSTFDLFRDEYQVPLIPYHIAAYFGTANELLMPVLLVLGLFARVGAGALLGMTVVIEVFVYPLNWAEHLTWATLLLFILSRGAGTISIDHFLAGKFFERQSYYVR